MTSSNNDRAGFIAGGSEFRWQTDTVSGRLGRKTACRSPKNPFTLKDFSAGLFPGSRRDHPETV
jgi:hypothetical protein